MMVRIAITILIIFSITAGFLLKSASLAAQDAATNAAKLEQQNQLQQELKQVEEQIAQYEKELVTIKGEKNTLQNKIKKLKKQQAKLSLEIKATTIKINDLDDKITSTRIAINRSQLASEKLNEQTGRILELIYERDRYPWLYTLANGGSLLSIISETRNYNQILRGVGDLLNQSKTLNQQLGQQKEILSGQQDDVENLLAIENLQQQGLTDSVGQQNTLLTQTKGKESNYQNVLADSKKQAQAIRNRLYQLLEVTTQITFGQAVEIATWASAQTGVRPAFLLAILTQESNLGKNVGTCNRPGDPPEKSWKVVMNPTRDQPPFRDITNELGMNPDITPISCPMRDKQGERIGWGGAMGPAQFIPSTWMGYKDKVAVVTGKTANPWDIRDAFLAAAIKLAAGGATSKSGEWAAAMIYFSGSTNPKYRFYGDSVIARAEDYQSDIDQINK